MLAFSPVVDVARWYTNGGADNTLTTFAAGLAFRAFYFDTNNIKPYLLLSVTPAYLSTRTFNSSRLGSSFAFEDGLGFGMQIGSKEKAFEFNLRF